MKAKLTITIDYHPSINELDKESTQNQIERILTLAAESVADDGLLSGDFEASSICHEVDFIEDTPTPSPSRSFSKGCGWWSINYEGVEPSECSLEHIGRLVTEGYNQGEIIEHTDDNN
ncbi:MAG: hypothetical protein V3V74_07325 [Nitrosomonadaceae bacterium]